MGHFYPVRALHVRLDARPLETLAQSPLSDEGASGQGASGQGVRPGSIRPGSIRVGPRRVGWNSAKPDDTWPGTRRRDNCRGHLLPNQVFNGRHSTLAGIADLDRRLRSGPKLPPPGDRPLDHRAVEILTKSFPPLRAPQSPPPLGSRGGEGQFARHASIWADCPSQDARQPGLRFVRWDAGKCPLNKSLRQWP